MHNKNQHDNSIPIAVSSNESLAPTKQNIPVINYLTIPFGIFLLLDLVTLGWYRLYWFYDNWRAIKKSENSDISPFWRAVFGIFFVEDIFKQIALSARSQGYAKALPHRLLAITYIVLVVVSKLLYLVLAFAMSSFPVDGAQGILLLFACIVICLKDLMFWPIQKAINFYDAKIEQASLLTITNKTPPVIKYFAVSSTRFVIFDILTVRMYPLYWCYKNWQAIKRAEHSNIRPFWRGCLAAFFVYTLFKKIAFSAKLNNYPKTFAYGRLATGYILVWVFFYFWSGLLQLPTHMSRLWYYILTLGIGVVTDCFFWLPVQKIIHFYNSKVNTNYKRKTALLRGEIILLIIGGIFYALLFTGKIYSSKLSATSFLPKLAKRSVVWETFQPASKNFKIKLPTDPSYETEELPINDDGLTAHYESYQSATSQAIIYSVSQLVYPIEIDLNQLEPKDFVDDIVASSSGNKLVNSKNRYVNKHRAVDFLIQSKHGYMRGRIILVGQTKYLLMKNYLEGSYNKEDYRRFINSFSLKSED